MLNNILREQKYQTPDPADPVYVDGAFGRHLPAATNPDWRPAGHEATRLFTHLAALKGTWIEICNKNDRLMQNELMTKPARLKAAADFAKERMSAALLSAGNCVADIEADLPRLRTRMQERLAPQTPADTALDTELRAYLRSVDDETRANVLSSDPRALRAAAFAPPGLSGLNAALHARVRDDYLQRHFPNELAAERDVQSGLELVKRARKALVDHVTDFIDLEAGERAAKFAE